jgi:hypothetical protein
MVWEGLNREFRERPKGEVVVIYRRVELSEAALKSYRDSVERMTMRSLFASFTEKREEAESHGRAWCGGVPVHFELRSASCPWLR